MALFVSTSEQTAGERLVPAELRAFILWLLERMDIPCVAVDEDLFRVALPAPHREAFENRAEVLFTFDAQRYDRATENDLEFAAPGHRFFRWLFELALSSGQIAQATPPDQPEHVSEIASGLFAAYEIDGGSVHLAGCSLEDRWIVNLKRKSATSEAFAELLIAPDGSELCDELRAQLKICSTLSSADGVSATGRISPAAANVICAQIGRGIRTFCTKQQEGQTGQDAPPTNGDAIAAGADEIAAVLRDVEQLVLIRTRWVSGKLRFTLGGETVDTSFSGWACGLEPPEIECPRTQQRTRRLSSTDDHRLAATESIVCCEETGRRVLEGELAVCHVTGKRVLPEFVGSCAVSGETVLTRSLLSCPRCKQLVSPTALSGTRCDGCRQTEAIKKTDPRLSLVLDEYTNLDSWRRWRLAETKVNFIVTAWRGWRRFLFVVEKETMQVSYLAKGNLRPGWVSVESAEEQAEILGLRL